MRSFGQTALVGSLLFLGVCGSPLEKRQETTTVSTSIPPVGLIVVTSGTTVITREFANPDATPTESVTTTAEATDTDAVPSRTGQPIPPVPAGEFPRCHKEDKARPFCQPEKDAEVYVGDTYYITWDPNLFASNATVDILLNPFNDTEKQTWSEKKILASKGRTHVRFEKEYLQTYQRYNLTFVLASYDTAISQAHYSEPLLVQLRYPPPRHLEPPPHNKLDNKEGLYIGLPVGLGALIFVMVGLCIGMRKTRRIGIGNVMGRRGRGYGARQSRRQRLGIGKRGAIQLDERELQEPRGAPDGKYRDDDRLEEIAPAPIREPGHGRDVSLGSLVSDGGNQKGGDNVFRSEIERQRTGR